MDANSETLRATLERVAKEALMKASKLIAAPDDSGGLIEASHLITAAASVERATSISPVE